MARAENIQLNVRSTFARARVQALARLTGMTASQVVEDALRGYVPPGVPANASANPGKLVRRGALLVRPARGKPISLAVANEVLDLSRERDLDD